MVQLVDGGGPPHVGPVRQQLAAHEHQVQGRLLQNLEAHQQIVRHHGHAARVESSSHLEARRPRIDEHGLAIQDALRHGRTDRALLRAVWGILQELFGVLVLGDRDRATVGAANEAGLGKVFQVPADG